MNFVCKFVYVYVCLGVSVCVVCLFVNVLIHLNFWLDNYDIQIS